MKDGWQCNICGQVAGDERKAVLTDLDELVVELKEGIEDAEKRASEYSGMYEQSNDRAFENMKDLQLCRGANLKIAFRRLMAIIEKHRRRK